MSLFADVILPVPFETFTYAVPKEMEGQVVEGSRVLVPLGKTKRYAGIVLRLHDQEPQGVLIKSIMEVLNAEPIVTPSQFRFWQWIANYYMAPLGDVYKAAFPGILKKVDKKTKTNTNLQLGVAKAKTCHSDGELPLLSLSSSLNTSQQKAYDAILETWQSKAITLLHGVTSSGKTVIYIHLILKFISEGKQVLYLLPEIALTTQITERLRKVFGDKLGVYHSKFSDKDRAEVYQRQLSDEPYDLILGVRSSVFLPFQNLGLVIVDEEHETSYKQQDPAPRYHARSAAMMLAQQCGAKTLLGTATPSIETYYLAQQGRYGYVTLTQRFADMQLPKIEVVDIKRLKFQKRMKGAFSPRLLEEIGQALERKEQVILFQNRRGFSSFVQCKKCGWVPRCQHCDVSLTYHKKTNNLTCHYCGKVYPLPPQCPECGNQDFGSIGTGTEKIEEQIKKFFPDARVSRMDLDTAKTRAAYEKIIDEFANFGSDILIGTQMVSKGLDFDNVSVVGILDADTMLNIPDFRSYERSYHTLAQVAGRAGRKNRVGKVILQTRSAESPIIEYVMNNDYAAMFQEQSEERKLFRYPPYYRLIYVYLRHRDNDLLQHLAEEMAKVLRQTFGERVLGPDKPVVSRVQSMHIRKIIIKMEMGASPSAVRTALMQAQNYMQSIPVAANLNVYYDVDPQ